MGMIYEISGIGTNGNIRVNEYLKNGKNKAEMGYYDLKPEKADEFVKKMTDVSKKNNLWNEIGFLTGALGGSFLGVAPFKGKKIGWVTAPVFAIISAFGLNALSQNYYTNKREKIANEFETQKGFILKNESQPEKLPEDIK